MTLELENGYGFILYYKQYKMYIKAYSTVRTV